MFEFKMTQVESSNWNLISKLQLWWQ